MELFFSSFDSFIENIHVLFTQAVCMLLTGVIILVLCVIGFCLQEASPRNCWKITHVALNKNHSLLQEALFVGESIYESTNTPNV
jgi:hypothetical protein